MRTIDADKVIEKLKEHKSLFCKNRDEFRALSDKDKARVDEIDTCIAELVNAEEVPHAQLGTNLAEVGTDCISRQAAIGALGDMPEGDDDFDTGCRQQWNWDTEAIKALPSAQPKNENLKFLEFLWNTINPNEMEQYLEMYSSKEVKSNG